MSMLPYTITHGNIVWNLPYRFPDAESSYRPKCINHGCNKPVAVMRGTIGIFKGREIRTVCSDCHLASYGKKDLKEGVTAHKKNYCENHDGHLGFPCTSTIHNSGMLELDHIDGNHFNNIPCNVQTLCKICHAYKSQLRGDFKKSPKDQRSQGLPPMNIVLQVLDLSDSTKNHPILQTSNLYNEDALLRQMLNSEGIPPKNPYDLF